MKTVKLTFLKTRRKVPMLGLGGRVFIDEAANPGAFAPLMPYQQVLAMVIEAAHEKRSSLEKVVDNVQVAANPDAGDYSLVPKLTCQQEMAMVIQAAHEKRSSLEKVIDNVQAAAELHDSEYENELLLQIAIESPTFTKLVRDSLQYLDESTDNHIPTWLGSFTHRSPKIQVQLVVTQHPDFTIDED